MASWSQISGIRLESYPQVEIGGGVRVRAGENGGMPGSSSAPRFLAPAQVAELLSIEVDEVIALVYEGRLRGSQLGSPARWRIEESSLAEYLAEQSEEARRMALWRQANEASFPEIWGSSAPHGI
jgi:excisionase family DNA binding protein